MEEQAHANERTWYDWFTVKLEESSRPRVLEFLVKVWQWGTIDC